MLSLRMQLAANGSGIMNPSVPGGIPLKNLFAGVPCDSFTGDKDKSVNAIITDSRRVVPGSLFFAINGLRSDGNQFIHEAIDRGAVGIVSDVLNKHSASHVSQIVVSNVRRTLGVISRRFYGKPDESLNVIGITGTNGKSTVAMLTQYLVSEPGGKAGLLGTVHYDLGGRTLPSYKTTPESVDSYAMFRQMLDSSCRHAVIEVSSHGIEQDRVYGMRIPVVAFLNLTKDHLDYHLDMEQYFAAKAKLFSGEIGNTPSTAVVNFDDSYGHRLLERIPGETKTITFGLNCEAMIRAEALQLSANGTQFQLIWPEGRAQVTTSQLGAYNVSNILAALAIAYGSGFKIEPLLEKLPAFPGVPGRMERVKTGQAFNVLVDYAHTDDALRNALTMLREITTGRIRVVFGCGGNRDRAKRALMTAVVQELADESWATSDNPRKESIEAIFADMRTGVSMPDKIHFVTDRRQAIRQALEVAEAGDCVLIAGKGHETFQEFADTVIPFDDRLVVRELLAIKELGQKK